VSLGIEVFIATFSVIVGFVAGLGAAVTALYLLAIGWLYVVTRFWR
jgi:hypothetical protein